jgi:hypothetical protein
VTIQAIIPIVIALRLQDEEDPQGCQIVEPLTLSQESMASPLFQNGLVRQLVYQCAHCPVLYCDVTMYNPVCQYEFMKYAMIDLFQDLCYLREFPL